MPRRYSDDQMSLILKRAAELQTVGTDSRYTLEQIQHAAREAGIDPQLVADAAATLEVPAPAERSLSGASAELRLSRWLPRRVDGQRRAQVVAAIRNHMPQAGEVVEVANGIEWRAGPADNKTAITIIPDGDRTMVRVDGRYTGAKGGLYLGAGVVSLIAAAFVARGGPETAFAFGVGMLGAAFFTARSVWNEIATRNRRRAEAVLKALEEEA